MKNFLRYAITSLTGLLIAFLIAYFKGVFSQTEVTEVMRILCDAAFVPGVIIGAVGLLVLVSAGGVFDMLAYGVRSLFVVFLRNPAKRKYKDYYEYRQAQKGKKRSFAYLTIVGGVFILIAVIFLVLFYTL
ncbi:MAG: DUF3899 domain-containing protein [Candidatus Coproplasma sp.]